MPGIGIITSLQAAEGTPNAQPILPAKTPYKSGTPEQPLPPTEPHTVNPVRNRLDIEV